LKVFVFRISPIQEFEFHLIQLNSLVYIPNDTNTTFLIIWKASPSLFGWFFV